VGGFELKHVGAGVLAVMLQARLCVARGVFGQFKESVAVGNQALELAERANDDWGRGYARLCLLTVEEIRGNFRDALRLAQQALAIAQQNGFVPMLPRAMSSVGLCETRLGRPAEGLPLVEKALEIAISTRQRHAETPVRADVAEALLVVGDRERAMKAIRELLLIADEGEDRAWRAIGLMLMGDLFRAVTRDPDAAGRSYREARTLATELEMRPFVARCELALGVLYTSSGQTSVARQHLRVGRELCQEMGLDHFVEKAEAEIKAHRSDLARGD
jgi:tetratricopeptide (TPR) repeat protein